MKLNIKAASTSRRIAIFIADSSSTTGAGLTGLTNASSGLTCYYWREDQGNAGATVVSLAAGTRGTWSSGGFVEKDSANMPGWYELGLPDAAIAAGAKWVTLLLKGGTNMAPLPIEIQLVAYDPDDAVALGLSRIDAAISSRSTYAGADTAGTTTLLGRVTGVVPVAADYSAARAAKLDNLDAAVSTRSTYAGADSAGTTTLLGRLSAVRAALLDNLDAAISSRPDAASVKAQAVAALSADNYAELAAVPAANASLASKIGWLFALARNKLTQTATTQTLRNDADSAAIAASAVSDDGTTFTRDKFA
jgi:hypothetical protein